MIDRVRVAGVVESRADYRSGSFASGGDPRASGAAVSCVLELTEVGGVWVARGTPHEGAVGFEARSRSKHAAALLVFAQWLGCDGELMEALGQRGAALGASLGAVLDAVDFTAGACRPNQPVGAVLPSALIERARAALAGQAVSALHAPAPNTSDGVFDPESSLERFRRG